VGGQRSSGPDPRWNANVGGQRSSGPDHDADVDAGDASGAGQVLHPTLAFSGA